MTCPSLAIENSVQWIQKSGTASWSVRGEHASVTFNGKIWVMGGEMEYGDVWNSADGVSWSQSTAWAWLYGREGHAAVVFSNKIWVLGGQTACPPDIFCLQPPQLNDVYCSDNGSSWEVVSFPDFINPVPWSGRSGHTALVFSNRIWIIGAGGNATFFPDRHNVWSSPNGRNWISHAITSPQGGPFAETRRYHTSVVFGGKMWIIGGYNGAGTQNDVWWSANGASWHLATANAAWAPRTDHASVVFDGKMWVIGGDTSGNISHTNDVWYSTDGSNWVLASTGPWESRKYHTAVVKDNKIWIIGGWRQWSISNPSVRLHDTWESLILPGATLGPVSIQESELVLSWDAIGVSHARVEWNSDIMKSNHWTIVGITSNSSIVVTNLSTNTTSFFRIVAP